MVLIIDEKTATKISQAEVNSIVEKAFAAYGLGKVEMPAKSYLHFKKGDLRCMPAFINLPGMQIAGMKSVNVHPHNPKLGLPTVMAVTLLVSPDTGQTLAIIAASGLTAKRTGAAGALATKYLSRKDSHSFGFIGTGVQARTQLEAQSLVRKIKMIKVYDKFAESANRFAKWAKQRFRVPVIICKNPKDACDVDVLTTATPSTKPIVKKSWILPGTHINAIGADAKGKQELAHDLVLASKIVVDDWTQASHSGELNTLVAKKKISESMIHSNLGQIAAGKKKGRTNDKEITLFVSTGLAIQDIAVGYSVYKRCLKKKEGKSINL